MSQWQYSPELKVQYQRVWTGALGTFLGWTAEQVARWAVRHEGDLDNVDPASLFFHEPPLRYIVGMIIPRSFYDRLPGSEYVQLQDAVMSAITGRGAFPEASLDFDWPLARSRVDAVLARFEAADDPPGP